MALVSMEEYRGVVLVTAAYFCVYYSMMFLQIHGKEAARQSYQTANRLTKDEARARWNRATDMNPSWVMADRSFLNALEQQVGFLLPLWLHAAFVSPHVSTVMGAIAVVARFFFPIFWSLKGGWNMWVEASTQPYYLVVFYFIGALTAMAIAGVNVTTDWPSWSLPLTGTHHHQQHTSIAGSA